MNWKRWLRGLCVSLLHGAFSGVVSLVVGVTWKQAALIILASVAKNGTVWITSHPPEDIAETTIIRKEDVKP